MEQLNDKFSQRENELKISNEEYYKQICQFKQTLNLFKEEKLQFQQQIEEKDREKNDILEKNQKI